MAPVKPSDVMLRVGGAMLTRFGVLTERFLPIVRGGEQQNESTFTRSSTADYYLDRDGKLRVAEAGAPRIEWSDKDADSVFETPGLLMEGQRTNVTLRSEEMDNAAWTNIGTPIVTANDVAAPDGTVTAEKIEDDDGAAQEARRQSVTIADDSTTWAASVFVKKALAGAPVAALQVELTGGAPAVNAEILVDPINGASIQGSSAVESDVIDHGDWWRVWVSVANNGTGNTVVRLNCYPAIRSTGDVGSATFLSATLGSNHFWGAQSENAAFPSSYIKTVAAAASRVADSLQPKFNWGVITAARDDFTIYARVPRPIHADNAGALGAIAGILQVSSGSTKFLRLYFQDATRDVIAGIRGTGTEKTSQQSIPSGATIEMSAQFADLSTAGFSKIDVGGGLSGPSATIDALTAFGDTTLMIGNINPATRHLFGSIASIVVARGLFTLKEMQAVPPS